MQSAPVHPGFASDSFMRVVKQADATAAHAATRRPAAHAGARAATAPAAIEMLQQKSLTPLVLGELRQQIVRGELAGGSKLNEADIAARLRVSRGPVREAFRALEQSGLVRTEKNRGVFVRQLSLQEADDIYEVRAALDALIGRLTAPAAKASPA
jgi:DNA-binding GntR family transcriptional regulator